MLPTITNRAMLVVTCLIAVVGAVDAGADDTWDLVAVFLLVALCQLVLLLRLSSRRTEVPVRADLVRWLRDRAEAEGDVAEFVADRAISAYRADLLGDADGHGDERRVDR